MNETPYVISHINVLSRSPSAKVHVLRQGSGIALCSMKLRGSNSVWQPLQTINDNTDITGISCKRCLSRYVRATSLAAAPRAAVAQSAASLQAAAPSAPKASQSALSQVATRTLLPSY